MLNTYLLQTQQLLQNPAAPASLYPTADLTGYINRARVQLSGDSESIRSLGTISTVVGQQGYPFSGISVVATTGAAGVLNLRSIRYALASGFQMVFSRSWEWFEFFYMNNPVPGSGAPEEWAQYAQGSSGTSTGSAASGSFYVNPIPDTVYALTCDVTCYPSALALDADPEALPWPWIDAVPYFAAYLALLSDQTNARMADAERYFGYYSTFKDRARQFSNGVLSRSQFEQAINLAQGNMFGIQTGGR